ncbi:MAG: hypothetical protein CMF52_09340 [Legionellales bacterium]|nr:hypothetical protein [Legionellales bacterium]|tara:strand:- start:12 stop:287 length:276 start_codon:yes stop_codon:yes gene_type:complete
MHLKVTPTYFNTVKRGVCFIHSMTEVCVGVDGYEFCSSGEVLVAAIVLECLFYIFLFIGGFEILRRWRESRARKERVKRRIELQQWGRPPK